MTTKGTIFEIRPPHPLFNDLLAGGSLSPSRTLPQNSQPKTPTTPTNTKRREGQGKGLVRVRDLLRKALRDRTNRRLGRNAASLPRTLRVQNLDNSRDTGV
jgi:hypothetical protein